MLTATVPCGGGALTEEGIPPLDGVGALLEDCRADEQELPCRVGNPDLWFAETPADLERAKVLCAECPIKAQCLEGALARREPWGVWGGEIFERGTVVARKRPRGRPRKSEQSTTSGTANPSRTTKKEVAA